MQQTVSVSASVSAPATATPKEVEGPILIDATDEFVYGHPAALSPTASPSFWAKEILAENADREMSFDDIDEELSKRGLSFDRESLRGGVYYGKRKGWAVRSSRGTWRYQDASAPVAPGAEEVESANDSPPDHSGAT